jgi:hypothetical protein
MPILLPCQDNHHSPDDPSETEIQNWNSIQGGSPMFRRLLAASIAACALTFAFSASEANAQQQAYGQTWNGQYQMNDWERFYHYPYVYYPQNYWGNEYYRSADSLYFRYPPEMRVPVYNRSWHNEYPQQKRYHWGHHFITDIF